MKKLAVLLLIAVALVLPLTAGGSKDSSSTSVKQTVLTLSEVHAEGYPTTLADYEFARLVEERTEGRIKIDVYSGGTLYGEETGSIEALQIGDLAFARVSASPVASYVPALNVIQLPYLYRDGEHMWQVLNGEIGQQMLVKTCNLIPPFQNNPYEPSDPLSRDIYEKVREGKAFNASAIVPNDHWSVLGAAMQKYLANRSDREELIQSIEAYWAEQN